jgi:hypothetical protein
MQALRTMSRIFYSLNWITIPGACTARRSIALSLFAAAERRRRERRRR